MEEKFPQRVGIGVGGGKMGCIVRGYRKGENMGEIRLKSRGINEDTLLPVLQAVNCNNAVGGSPLVSFSVV